MVRAKWFYLLVSAITILGEAGLASGAIPQTNDVDKVFSMIGRRHPLQVFIDARAMASEMDAQGDCPGEIRRYYLDRLLGFQVSTNMPRAASVLRAKAGALSEYEWELGRFCTEGDVDGILVQATLVQACSTGHLAAVFLVAEEKDALMGWKPDRPHNRRASSGRHGPNVSAAMSHSRNIREWNKAVPEYRRTLVEVATNQLSRLFGDLPLEERQSKVVEKLRTHGLLPTD